MKLYTYWRSSAAYRVRIGLNLKGLTYENAFLHLVKDGGEHLKEAYHAINAQQLVPSFETDNAQTLGQSLAILEYLEEAYPDTTALLPKDVFERAEVRALAHSIAVDVHPVNNLRILKYLVGEMGVSEEDKMKWYHHWIKLGFDAFEETLKRQNKSGDFCYGDTPGLADICLIPQVYNANRFEVDMSPYPRISQINKNCLKLDAFKAASPEEQGDAV